VPLQDGTASTCILELRPWHAASKHVEFANNRKAQSISRSLPVCVENPRLQSSSDAKPKHVLLNQPRFIPRFCVIGARPLLAEQPEDSRAKHKPRTPQRWLAASVWGLEIFSPIHVSLSLPCLVPVLPQPFAGPRSCDRVPDSPEDLRISKQSIRTTALDGRDISGFGSGRYTSCGLWIIQFHLGRIRDWPSALAKKHEEP
jgi:hypothetical protein